MHSTCTGLIIRTTPLTDTSLICHWLSPENGRIKTVAKGARRPDSPFRGRLDLFFLSKLLINPSRKSDLHILKECSVQETFPKIRNSYLSLNAAVYASDLIGRHMEAESPDREYFDLMLAWLQALDLKAYDPVMVTSFELKFLKTSGLEMPLHLLPDDLKKLAAGLLEQPYSQLGISDDARPAFDVLRSRVSVFLSHQIGPPSKIRAVLK